MSINIYPGGFFRSREGYKCICIHERRGGDYPFGTVRVDAHRVLIYVTFEGRAMKGADSLNDLVEEVNSTEPDYVDPLQPTVLPTKDIWEGVNELVSGFELHRFSSKTNVQDVRAEGMPQSMRVKLDRTNVHKVWRCRSGRGSDWYYGWSKEESIKNLLAKGASPHRATAQR